MSHAIARRFIALVTVAVLWITATADANAAMIGTDQILGRAHLENYEHVRKLHAALARSDIRAELERLGVHPDAVRLRIERLTHRELAQVNGRIASLPVGGDRDPLSGVPGVLGIILFFVLIAVVLVVGFIYLLFKSVMFIVGDDESAQNGPSAQTDCPAGSRQGCRIGEQPDDDVESADEPSTYAIECPVGRGPGC